jgi:hypothetical protein
MLLRMVFTTALAVPITAVKRLNSSNCSAWHCIRSTRVFTALVNGHPRLLPHTESMVISWTYRGSWAITLSLPNPRCVIPTSARGPACQIACLTRSVAARDPRGCDRASSSSGGNGVQAISSRPVQTSAHSGLSRSAWGLSPLFSP